MRDWWADRVEAGSIRATAEGWRFTAAAEASLVNALRERADAG